MPSSRREFLTAASVSGAASLAASAAAAAAAQHLPRGGRPPNIVFILADDLGIGDLGCYGQKVIRTPNIDKLAAEGMRFTGAYSGCTVCAPSRSVLMTGYHMGHTSVRGNTGGQSLSSSDVTIPQLLKQAGYVTGGFGKWGLGDLGTEGVPWQKGFDRFFGYLHQIHAHFFYPRFLMDNNERHLLAGNEKGGRQTYSHDVIASKALEFIEANKSRPFFCYVPFTIPHWELLVPEDSLAEYRGKMPERAFIDERKHYADQPEGRAAYAGMITRMDRDVGRIVALIEKLGLTGDTIIFFSSDNGAATRLKKEEFFNSTAGLRGHKQNMYEGGIRTPFLARWPGRIKPGSTTPHLCNFADVLPTLCDLAGRRPPAGIDGISFVPTLLGRAKQQRRQPYLYWELPRFDAQTKKFRNELPMAAARSGDWKVVRPAHDAALELYNLREDPFEERNLAESKPAELARLEKVLASARTEPRSLYEPGKHYWDE